MRFKIRMAHNEYGRIVNLANMRELKEYIADDFSDFPYVKLLDVKFNASPVPDEDFGTFYYVIATFRTFDNDAAVTEFTVGKSDWFDFSKSREINKTALDSSRNGFSECCHYPILLRHHQIAAVQKWHYICGRCKARCKRETT